MDREADRLRRVVPTLLGLLAQLTLHNHIKQTKVELLEQHQLPPTLFECSIFRKHDADINQMLM